MISSQSFDEQPRTYSDKSQVPLGNMTDPSTNPLVKTHNMLAVMSTLLESLNTSAPSAARKEEEMSGMVHSSDKLRAEPVAQSFDQLRAELAAARSRELDLVSRSQELAYELHQSHEHSHLIEEYAERLQAVIGLRDCEVADLRSELQSYRRSAEAPSTLCESRPSFQYAWQPYLDIAQDCESGGEISRNSHQCLNAAPLDCREELRVKWDQVASLRQELLSLSEPANRKDFQVQASPAAKVEKGLVRSRVACNGDAKESDPGALFVSCRGSLQEIGSLPVDLGSHDTPEVLRSKLSTCLHDNAQLKCSVEDLKAETEESLQQERELQEAFFEQTARLNSVEEAAAHACSCAMRELVEHHEIAWQEEANTARTLRVDLDTKLHAISDLSQMVRKGVNEFLEQEGALAAAALESKSLQAEVYVQKAQVELLRSELRHSSIPYSRHAADQEFEEHVREVMEIATTFKTELCCVKKAGGAVVSREIEAITSRQANQELEAHLHEARSSTASAVQQASHLREELTSRGNEVTWLRSELWEGGSLRVRADGGSLRTRTPTRSKSPSRIQICAVAPSGRSMLRTATPPRKSAALPLQTTTPRRIVTPPAAFRVGVQSQTASAALSQTALRVNFQEMPPLPTGTPTAVRLGARECLPFSPTPGPCTRILPVGSQAVLQAESAATVHERLRQRILGSGSVDASTT